VGSLVLYEILSHWPQYATHIPRRLASWLFTRPLEPPIRYESIGQVTDNETLQAVRLGPDLFYIEAASRSPTRKRTSKAATSGTTTHLEAPRSPAITVATRLIGAKKDSSAKSNVSGSFQGGRYGEGFTV
jgi:hypothetical protein